MLTIAKINYSSREGNVFSSRGEKLLYGLSAENERFELLDFLLLILLISKCR